MNIYWIMSILNGVSSHCKGAKQENPLDEELSRKVYDSDKLL